MNNATPKQLSTIGFLCNKLKLSAEEKETIVQAFSATHKTSSKDLSVQEALLMIQHLNTLMPDRPDTSAMIGKMLSLCYEMAVLQPTEKWTKVNDKGKLVANGQRLDQWALKYGYLKKKVNHYKYKELPKLVFQFEAYYASQLKRF